MILYNIIKDEWARNKSKDDSTVSVRYKFPINLPKETKSVLVLFSLIPLNIIKNKTRLGDQIIG